MYFYETDKNNLKGLALDRLVLSLNSKQLSVFDEFITEVAKEALASCSTGREYGLTDCKMNPSTGEILVKLTSVNGILELYENDFHELLKGAATVVKCKVALASEELKYVAYIKSIDAYNEYMTETYKPNVYEVVQSEGCEVAKHFLENGLILPKRYREMFALKWVRAYNTKKFTELMREFTGNIVGDSYYSESNAFIRDIRNRIMWEDDKLVRQELASRLYTYIELYDGLTGNGRIDIMNYAKASSKLAYYVHAKNGDRLATVGEKKDLVKGLFKRRYYYMPEDKVPHLLLFVWSCTGNERLVKEYFPFIDEDTSPAEDRLWAVLNEAVQYLLSDEFLKKDIFQLQKGMKPLKYPESAEDEIFDKSKEEKVRAVYAAFKDGRDDYSRMINDICLKALKSRVRLSEKQINVINNAYDRILEVDNRVNKFDDTLAQRIRKILEFYTYNKKDFEYVFLRKILERKRCSVKQYEVYESIYERYLEDIKNYQSSLTIDVIETEEDDDEDAYLTLVDSGVEDAKEEETARKSGISLDVELPTELEFGSSSELEDTIYNGIDDEEFFM